MVHSSKVTWQIAAFLLNCFEFSRVPLWLYASPTWLEECILFLIKCYSELISLYKISALGFALLSLWACTSTLICVIQTHTYTAFFTVSPSLRFVFNILSYYFLSSTSWSFSLSLLPLSGSFNLKPLQAQYYCSEETY